VITVKNLGEKYLTESELQPAEKLKREIAKSYDSNPKGWRVLVGKDNRNFSQILVSNGSQVWILKEEMINPYRSIGLGARLTGEIEAPKVSSTKEFGLRPLAQGQIGELSSLLRNGEDPKDFLLKVMTSEPVASNDVKGPMVLQGPIMATSNSTSLLSDKHREIDHRISEELQKLLLRKYPQAVIPYL